MSNNDSWTAHLSKILAIPKLKKPASNSFRDLVKSVEKLPKTRMMSPCEAAVCCGIGTVAGLAYRERTFGALPWKYGWVDHEGAAAQKRVHGRGVAAGKSEKKGKRKRRRGEGLRSDRKVLLRHLLLWKKKFEAQSKAKKVEAALAREKRKKEKRGPLSLEEHILRDLKIIARRRANGDLTVVQKVLLHAITDNGGRIAALVANTSLTGVQMSDVLRSGGGIEMLSLDEAITKRVWLKPEERAPWAELYASTVRSAVAKSKAAGEEAPKS